jgi:1-acyl-sn-glycerol-3-phosphate acyltransferase
VTLEHAEAHELARAGASPRFYQSVRKGLLPLFKAYFRFEHEGAENVPDEGGAIIAPNHKSFSDAFFIGAALPRQIRFMGKAELFQGRLGPTFIKLGAFPVRRGESDAEAIETARRVLEDGELLVMFPEGTRVRETEELGDPRKGVARLAIETGVPIVPCAITGTEKLRRGALVRPGKVRLRFGEPIYPQTDVATPESAGELMDEAVWPEITEHYHGLRARPGVIAAGLAAVGVGAYLANRRRRSKRR